MNPKLDHFLFNTLGITSDGLTLFIGKIVAAILALAGLVQQAGGAELLASMGIKTAWQPYLLLAAFVIGIFSHGYGASSLPTKAEAAAVSTTGRVSSQAGFVWIIIPIILAGGFLVATVAKVHISILNPQTKIGGAKLARGAREGVHGFQEEEEKLWHTRAVPALSSVDASGKTLHQQINVEVLTLDQLIDQIAAAVQKLPIGGTLSLSDLAFVTQAEQVLVRLLDLVKSNLGSALSASIDALNSKVAAFSAAAKAVKS